MPHPNQNRSRQRRTVMDARRLGKVDELRWLLEADVPGQGEVLANAPPGWVPVVPVSHEDPRQDAGLVMLKVSFEHHNPGARFLVILTRTVDLERAGVSWYEWGEEIRTVVDHVCPGCGMVAQGPPLPRLACCE